MTFYCNFLFYQGYFIKVLILSVWFYENQWNFSDKQLALNVLLGSKDVSTLSSIYHETGRRHHVNVIKQMQITLMEDKTGIVVAMIIR